MKINIYGVGRSGTKALQLYLIHNILQSYKNVKINYEPFWYSNRLLKPSKYGRHLHQTLPHFISDDFRNRKADKYFEELTKSKFPVVTKLIRANGRINYINKITQPDVNIFIVRGLYDYLKSILKQNWNIIASKDWKKFCEEAKKIDYSEINNYLIPTSNKILQHAVYWYFFNRYALENLSVQNSYIIRYEELNKVDNILNKIGFENQNSEYTISNFDGNLLHKKKLFKKESFLKKQIDYDFILNNSHIFEKKAKLEFNIKVESHSLLNNIQNEIDSIINRFNRDYIF